MSSNPFTKTILYLPYIRTVLIDLYSCVSNYYILRAYHGVNTLHELSLALTAPTHVTFHFHRWRNRGSERLGNFQKTT